VTALLKPFIGKMSCGAAVGGSSARPEHGDPHGSSLTTSKVRWGEPHGSPTTASGVAADGREDKDLNLNSDFSGLILKVLNLWSF
jgi:hypothetical protein